MNHRQVFIIGAAGMVGAGVASALALQGIAGDIVLIDIAEGAVRGQAMDLDHATGYAHGPRIRVGDYSDISEDDIVVITAGLPRHADQTRTQLFVTNARIVENVVGKVMAQGKPVLIVMVTNPVDALTQVALEASGLPRERVFGTGTMLDTARLRTMLARELNVSPDHIHGYVLGEHGQTAFATISSLNVGGIPLADFPGYQPTLIAGLNADIRSASQKIIEAKKATHFGIAQVVSKLVEALLRPTTTIFPICMLTQGEYGLQDVVIGLPAAISATGAKILKNYPLSAAETALLQQSATTIRETVAEYHSGKDH